MKKKLTKIFLTFSVSSGFFLGAGGSRLSAANTYLTALKVQNFDQTSANAPTADLFAPFQFTANSFLSLSITPPGGSAISLPATQSGYSYVASFGNRAAFEAAFPNGSYAFLVTGISFLQINLAGDLYPVTPQLTTGTWNSSGQLVIDPTQSTTLNFNGFPGYATSGIISHMGIQIHSYPGGAVNLNQSNITPTNPAGFNSFVIPANRLSPGTIYQCTIDYDTVLAQDTSALTVYSAVTGYSVQTLFTLVTSGTAAGLPTITQQPTNQTAPLGATVTFGLSFNGGNPVNVQWFKNGVPMPAAYATSGSLVLPNIQSSDVASYFAVLVDSSGHYIQSNTVTLAQGASSFPSVTTQPRGHAVASGGSVVLGAEISGGNLTYQWKKNGANVSGATSSQLLISNAQPGDGGSYTLTATNDTGSVTTTAAVLSVAATSDPGRLINVSVRIVSGADANVLIMGFVAGGAGTSGTKQLLIRGVGPTLTSFGVPGAMVDPILQIIPGGGSTPLASNDNWAGDATVTATANAVGAFALPDTTSKDAALVTSLPGGVYSAKIPGANNSSGTVLSEIYDANPGTFSATAPRLVNISARATSSNDNPLIAGFVIGGSTAKTLMIRAIGPYLSQYFGASAMSDPKLELHLRQGGVDSVLFTNDNWGGSALLTSTGNSVGAFSLPDASSKDAVLLVTLDPGVYSANVVGVNNATGVTLVEVYEVP